MPRITPLALFILLAVAPALVKENPGYEARYYTSLANKMVQCQLCPRRCIIPPGKRGFCRVRENRDGKLYSLVYG